MSTMPKSELPDDCVIMGERIASIWEMVCREAGTDPHTFRGVQIMCVPILEPSEIYGFGKGAKVVNLLPSQKEIDERGARNKR